MELYVGILELYNWILNLKKKFKVVRDKRYIVYQEIGIIVTVDFLEKSNGNKFLKQLK